MHRDMAGLKIRRLRKQGEMTQGELARRAGISASYLNLIESNKRATSGDLLERIARGLGVDRAVLDGQAERRVIEELNEVSADPDLPARTSPGVSAEEFVSRYPGWANLLLHIYQSYRQTNQAVLALADRLNRDPFLGESVHRMLTHVTAIRAAAEIAAMGEEIEPADRVRFLGIVASDSAELSRTAKSIVEFFESAHTRVRSATPTEQVDAFLFESQNHFPELETYAEDALRHRRIDEIIASAGNGRAERVGSGLTAGHLAAGPMPAETRRFEIVRSLAMDAAFKEIDAIVARHPVLAGQVVRQTATNALAAYTAGAMLMPYGPFLEAAERYRYDLDMLMRHFEVSYEQAAHRLATLRRPGAEGIRFAFMRSDPSGYITKRMPLPRLPLPRYGNACPLWVVYGAFQTPGVTQRCFGQLPSGEDFLFFARAIEKRPARPGFPRQLVSVMLACDALDAHRISVGDGIDRARAIVPVGTTCRLCTRQDCEHRQELPLLM